MNLDPIKPYADLLKVIAVAVVALVLCSLLFMGGCSVGKGQSVKKIAALNRIIATKNSSLEASAESLRAAGSSLRAVNAEARRRIAEADKAEDAAKLAGVVAASAQAAADKRQATFAGEIARARRNPTCAALLGADLRATCGL